MSVPFTLRVPADARYRVLAPELASKYVEISGGAVADGTALAASLSDAMDRLLDGAGAGADFELSFRVGTGGIEVTVQCAGRSTIVKAPVATPKH
jgi:hypothetical protein